jgi:Na+/H+ antiporter NhaD/arsenite permease-like protein
MDITIVIFLLVYLVLALGYLPGFKVDRTGAAVVGALAMIGFQCITEKEAWASIDYKTIGLLFGLMVVSGAFTVAGFYDFMTLKVANLKISPPKLLALLILTGAGLSSILTNDVVVVAMTPLLVAITMSRGLNPTPFLLGFCFATNTGSVATLIGSPQNIIAAQALGISFTGFLKASLLPGLVSLPIVWGVVTLIYRKKWDLKSPKDSSVGAAAKAVIPLDRNETIKAAIVMIAVVVAFAVTDWPREIVAMSAAGIMLINRKVSSKDVLGTVDTNLILLLIGLFVVNGALSQTGLPQEFINYLKGKGVDFANPMVLFIISSVLSNTVGNNPAVMLLVPFLPHGGNPDALGAALALGTGFSSNLIVFGSLAGIIVVEQAASRGVKISMKEFCLSGVPVTIACFLLALFWIGVVL